MTSRLSSLLARSDAPESHMHSPAASHTPGDSMTSSHRFGDSSTSPGPGTYAARSSTYGKNKGRKMKSRSSSLPRLRFPSAVRSSTRQQKKNENPTPGPGSFYTDSSSAKINNRKGNFRSTLGATFRKVFHKKDHAEGSGRPAFYEALSDPHDNGMTLNGMHIGQQYNEKETALSDVSF
uniref:Uncharacterized protein n=1 Tax=Octactis speculum TaxID=3111310 RepID=A0A7S2GB26_9STRA